NALGDVLGGVNILNGHVDRGDAADHAEQRLRGAQRHEGGALVDALAAEIDQARNRQQRLAPDAASMFSLSPTVAPRSLASSMPMIMSSLVSRGSPATT